MRLLKTDLGTGEDGKLELIERWGSAIPPYAILSHTWSQNAEDEVLFANVQDGTAHQKPAFSKVQEALKRAKLDGHDYIWIDNCCIDKSSSTELSEAINSMYRYYHDAAICYAYLADVHDTEDLRASRWFCAFEAGHVDWSALYAFLRKPHSLKVMGEQIHLSEQTVTALADEEIQDGMKAYLVTIVIEPHLSTPTAKKQEPHSSIQTAKKQEPHSSTQTVKRQEPHLSTQTAEKREPYSSTQTAKKQEPRSSTQTAKNQEHRKVSVASSSEPSIGPTDGKVRWYQRLLKA